MEGWKAVDPPCHFAKMGVSPSYPDWQFGIEGKIAPEMTTAPRLGHYSAEPPLEAAGNRCLQLRSDRFLIQQRRAGQRIDEALHPIGGVEIGVDMPLFLDASL